MRRQRDERGSITPLVLGLALIAMVLIAGTVAVTSAQLARMQLIDAADGAALSAANAFDAGAYGAGIGQALPLSNASVRARAAEYLASSRLPGNITAWRLEPGTGTADGQTATVVLSGTAQLPMVGGMLRALGGEITIHVTSSARSDVLP